MPELSFRARLLSASALACGSVAVAGTPAAAGCVPSGSAVTCSGETNGGFVGDRQPT